MKSVSTTFKNKILQNVPIYAKATATLQDNTVLNLTSENDFFITGNSYSEGGTNGFMLGEAICKTVALSIDNHDSRYSNYDFNGASIVLDSYVDITANTIEPLREGIFTVVDAVKPGDIIELTAFDNMCKTDRRYTRVHSTPITAGLLLQRICTDCNLTLGTPNFANYDFVVNKVPTNTTCRELIGYIAQIASGNAYINNVGALCIKSYDLNGYNAIQVVSGGENTGELIDNVNGGVTNDVLDNVIISSNISTNSNYHILSEFSAAPEIFTDDITITGIVAEIEATSGNQSVNEYVIGTKDYALKVNNPLIIGNITNGLSCIASNVVGMTVRPFSGTFLPNPLIECMDTVLVIDKSYNTYKSIVTGFSYNYLGNCDVENTTKSPEKNNAVFTSNAVEAYRQAKEIVEQDKTAWEQAVNGLNTAITNSPGLYETKEIVAADNSTIYYFHDKPSLDDSELVIKVTEDAIGISNTGKNGIYDVGLNTITGNWGNVC